MIWGYLTEFWNAITSVGEYTIDFFRNIGNAVAGAIGNLFAFIIHSITDIFVFGGWVIKSLGTFFANILQPIKFVFGFLKSFIDGAFATPVSSDPIWDFNPELMSVFNAIPYWTTISTVLGVCVLFVIGMAIVKQLTRI